MAAPLPSSTPERAPAGRPLASLSPAWAAVRRVLILRLDNIGDVVLAGPAMEAVRRSLPEVWITLMASPAGAQAAPLLPAVDDVFLWRTLWQDLGQLDFDPEREWELINRLRAGRFDAAIILTSFSQAPHAPAAACALAGIPLRLGEAKEVMPGLLTDAMPVPAVELHAAERNLRLVEAAGFSAPTRRLRLVVPATSRAAARQKLAAAGLDAGAPYVLLSPWASCQARTYFPDRFAAAARRLADLTGWAIVVTGAPRDRSRSEAILRPLGEQAIDLVGETTIPELAALADDARLTLVNDSLAMHLSEALNTPSVVLYSGTELESQWAPRYSPHRLLRRPTACSPCYGFSCPYNLECLDIPPEEVVAAGLSLLGRNQGNGRPAIGNSLLLSPGW